MVTNFSHKSKANLVGNISFQGQVQVFHMVHCDCSCPPRAEQDSTPLLSFAGSSFPVKNKQTQWNKRANSSFFVAVKKCRIVFVDNRPQALSWVCKTLGLRLVRPTLSDLFLVCLCFAWFSWDGNFYNWSGVCLWFTFVCLWWRPALLYRQQ